MKTGTNKKALLTLSLLALLSLVGCTAERPYEFLDKDNTKISTKEVRKSAIDTEALQLYVPSSLNSSRSTDATFPMYMGDSKIVKLQITENSLDIVQIELDERFGNNPVNDKPVLRIPIEHVDYRCATDADGECTNKEEVDLSKPWKNRRFIRVDANRLDVQEVNFLPIQIRNLFYPCYNAIGSNAVTLDIDNDAINIGIEKVYKADLECATSLNNLSDLTFRVVYHYSIVKMNKLTTAGYKALEYPKDEENTFGFFTENTLKLDSDNNSVVDSQKQFVGRWSPNRKVVYHLTENFNKPEHAKVKAATVKAINNINNTLKKAGAKLQIELRDAFPGMNPGDLRVNSIVMVEDPVNFGILGYGPSARNPRTGEIVHARAAMYLGVIKKGIKRAYEDVVKEKKAKAEVSSDIKLSPELVKHSGPVTKMNVAGYLQAKKNLALPNTKIHDVHNHKVSKINKNANGILNPAKLDKLQEAATHLHERKLTLRDAQMLKDDPSIREQFMSSHCYYDIEHFNIHDSLELELDELVEELGNREWKELAQSEKDRVIDTLIPFVWVPTLIHEVGHTLGLRHNFAGSEDQENFYTEQELSEMGIKRKFEYSSVMDYGYRATNELQVMGKYDIAALRYGYAEKVEVVTDEGPKLISIDVFRKGGSTLKDYKYCTDEHVAVNPNCNRFDEGTSLSGIADHWINMYEDGYSRRNFRNNSLIFSLYDDATQISRLNLILGSLRTMFDRYEGIKNQFGLPDDSPYWEQIDFLKDLKTATIKAGKFYLKILETPDTMCAVATAAQPDTIIALLSIRQLSANAISCFDSENIGINPEYVVVGEAGRSHQSRKDPRADHPYANYLDQIDVRGIWLDKLLALDALTARITGIESFDEYTDNFLDIADIKDEVQSRLSAIILDQTVTQVPITTKSGQVLVAEVPVSFYNKVASQNGSRIEKPLHPGIQKLFGIPNKGIDFQVQLINMLKLELESHEQTVDASSLLNSLTAQDELKSSDSADNYIQTKVGLTQYFAPVSSEISSIAVMSREVIILLTSLGNDKVTEIATLLIEGKPLPEGATEQEKLAFSLGAEILVRFLQQGFQDASFYEKILGAML